ncbi:MAG TPA: hypothetical protein EYP53_00355 [Candidatus Latescibacteria bacterium]|nr:hypothetical protein [Candidatus Latescibacterota bacterium]
MSIFERLTRIDRRIIFCTVALAVIIPLLRPIGFPVSVSPSVKKLYDAIEALPPGSRVLMSFDYDPSTMPEVYPMNFSIAKHCFKRGLKVYGMALWATGVSLGQDALEKAAKQYDKAYGVDYINLGFKAGGIVVISAMAENVVETFPEDYAGRSVGQFPVMKGVRNFDDFDLIVDFSAGDPGVIQWIMIAYGRYGKKVGAGCTAVSAPAFYPYLNAGQLVGLLGGMKGAAEYEKLMDYMGTATAGMDAQSVVHALIVFYVLFGNAMYLVERRRSRRNRL